MEGGAGRDVNEGQGDCGPASYTSPHMGSRTTPHTLHHTISNRRNKQRPSVLADGVSFSVGQLPVWRPRSCGNVADQVCERREKQAVATSPGSLHMSRPDLSHCCS